jgi:hypothetical protein
MSEEYIDRRKKYFETCPKYVRHELSEDQIIAIAKRAVILAKDEVYKDVGKSITGKFFYLVGAITLSIYAWMTANGYLKG